MSDLAPTGAYFLLRCLNIILTMFLWPRPVAASRNPKFCEASNHAFGNSTRDGYVAAKNSSILSSFSCTYAYHFVYESVCVFAWSCLSLWTLCPFQTSRFLIASIEFEPNGLPLKFLAKRYLPSRSFVSSIKRQWPLVWRYVARSASRFVASSDHELSDYTLECSTYDHADSPCYISFCVTNKNLFEFSDFNRVSVGLLNSPVLTFEH